MSMALGEWMTTTMMMIWRLSYLPSHQTLLQHRNLKKVVSMLPNIILSNLTIILPILLYHVARPKLIPQEDLDKMVKESIKDDDDDDDDSVDENDPDLLVRVNFKVYL